MEFRNRLNIQTWMEIIFCKKAYQESIFGVKKHLNKSVSGQLFQARGSKRTKKFLSQGPIENYLMVSVAQLL